MWTPAVSLHGVPKQTNIQTASGGATTDFFREPLRDRFVFGGGVMKQQGLMNGGLVQYLDIHVFDHRCILVYYSSKCVFFFFRVRRGFVEGVAVHARDTGVGSEERILRDSDKRHTPRSQKQPRARASHSKTGTQPMASLVGVCMRRHLTRAPTGDVLNTAYRAARVPSS